MSALEVLERLKHLTNPERLAVIETATRLIREDIAGPCLSLGSKTVGFAPRLKRSKIFTDRAAD